MAFFRGGDLWETSKTIENYSKHQMRAQKQYDQSDDQRRVDERERDDIREREPAVRVERRKARGVKGLSEGELRGVLGADNHLDKGGETAGQ